MHKQMNQTLRKSPYGIRISQVSLSSKAFSELNSQRTCVANFVVLTSIQPKIQASKVSEFVPLALMSIIYVN